MTLLRRTFGVLAWVLFIAGELHAFWVLRPMSNIDHAWIAFADDSIVPFQFRLASYRARVVAFGDPGFLIPAALGLSLAVYLVMRKASKKVPALVIPWPGPSHGEPAHRTAKPI